MKKMLIGSTLALGLFFVGVGQSSASSIQGMEVPHVNIEISSIDIETTLLMVQNERVKVLESQMGALLAEIQKARENASLSNTQQMDMLRLQSLINKRNEAFDIMTNFTKKMQDSRTSIIENMR